MVCGPLSTARAAGAVPAQATGRTTALAWLAAGFFICGLRKFMRLHLGAGVAVPSPAHRENRFPGRRGGERA